MGSPHWCLRYHVLLCCFLRDSFWQRRARFGVECCWGGGWVGDAGRVAARTQATGLPFHQHVVLGMCLRFFVLIARVRRAVAPASGRLCLHQEQTARPVLSTGVCVAFDGGLLSPSPLLGEWVHLPNPLVWVLSP